MENVVVLKPLDLILRLLLTAGGLVELYIASRMALPGALVPLAIGVGLLAWQAISLKKALGTRKPDGS
jgi:hypothetical protein